MTAALVMPTELTIYTAAETRQAWLAALAEPAEGPLCVAADAVAEADAAGVQLVLALSRSLAERSRSLRLVDPSPALRGACERLGLSALLSSGDAA